MPTADDRLDEAWRVDWANACLWHGGALVPLPPKVFAVLRLLVEHAGQLVTKEALLHAVWPEMAVSETVLTNGIGELRKVLGETAQAPRFIQTVHRRGYRFIGDLPTVTVPTPPVSSPFPVTAPAPPASAPALLLPPATPPLCVGRDGVLAQLHRWLAHVRQGARHIVFLTGEPGLGKTTVVNAFVAQAAAVGDLWLARGHCIEHYGAGEAYLPVLEALGRLGRAPGGAPLLAVLEQQAPTWLAQMPALLSATALEAVRHRVLGATQERMLRELAEAVEALTATRPLLLILEDVHWSDYATLDLVTYLARRAGPARLLLLGTYRPIEVLLHGHPVQKVKQDLVRHGQGVELPLELLTAAEVAQYLALRGAGGVALPPAVGELAQRLYQRTDGHPLFLVQVVEHLRQRGVLGAGGGPRQVSPETLAAALEIPTSVRQLIEQQFGRLSPEEQRVLEAASVAGSACTAAAMAAGLERALEAVEDVCAGLVQRGQFLLASGVETWPDGTVTERYGWRHAVHQEVVYARVPEGRRLRLHQRIGTREEAGYGARVSERAAELAMHFERGHDAVRAVRYRQQAAAQALGRYADQEAVSHLTQGLALLAQLPETPARAQQELDLQLALGPALIATKGTAASEVEQTYARARALCAQVGDTPQLFPTLWGLCRFYNTRGALPTARELAEQLLRLAQREADSMHSLVAHEALGTNLFYQGEFAAAWSHLERGIARSDPTAERARWLLYSTPPEVRCLIHAALTLWCLGYPAQALQRSQEAQTLAQALAHPYSVVDAQYYAAILHHRRREVPAAQAQAEVLLTQATAQGFRAYVGYGILLGGWALAMQGQGETGLAQLRQGLATVLATGQMLSRPFCLILLAEAAGHVGQVEEGLRLLAETRTAIEESGRGDLLAEAYRLQGVLLLQQAVPDMAQAEACFQQALTIARRQQAKSWELRSATSLVRLWQHQGKRVAARELLAPVYGWFTEGFDTADLQEAKALLAALT